MRTDYILLFLAIIMQQVHPIFVCIFFAVILLRDVFYRRTYHAFNYNSLLVIFIFALFSFYGYTNSNLTIYNAFWYAVPSVFAIFIGQNFSLKMKSQEDILAFLFFLAIVIAIPHVCITLGDIFQNGLVNPKRILSIAGYGDEQRRTTARTVELSLAISGISAIFMKSLYAPKRLTYALVSLSIIAELCTLHFVSRTGISLLLIALLVGFFITKRNIKQSFIVLAMMLLACIIFENSELFQIFSKREITGSSIADAGGRTKRWAMGFYLLFEKPLGYNIDGWYAHNFWLDFGRVGGLISFILLSIFSFIQLLMSYKLRYAQFIDEYNYLMIAVFTIIFVCTMFTEPIHSGAPLYMYTYFMFCGFVYGLKSLYK